MEHKDTMHQAQEKGRKALHEAFETIGRATGAAVEMQRDFLKMQEDLLGAWAGATRTPGERGSRPTPDLEHFQGRWAESMDQMLQRRREVLDLQYHGALATMEQALCLGRTSSPEAFAERIEPFLRDTLAAWHKSSEAQLNEFQDAAKTLLEFASSPFGRTEV